MGAVYLAVHPLIGKKIALKVIHRELSGNREIVQRFFQEARVVNQIGNEHIVEIHDFGVSPDNDHFYIMEYLEGRTLASILAKDGMLDVMRALHVGAQIASALSAAHDAGVIHRDVKPDNIMLMKRLGDPDFVKVLDFGLAKMFSAQNASAVKTAAGVLLGTPQYMSPEACESKSGIDHRTDIYALGVLLFQMTTGKLPFDGESMGEVLVKQVTALPPAPRGLNPAIPPSVEQVLLRCLAKAPGARFPTMHSLREALLDPEAYLGASPPIAPARSVAPGESTVDAKTVIAYANAAARPARSKTQPGRFSAEPWQVANTMNDVDSEKPESRTVAAMLTGLALPAEPSHNTMRIATPVGYSSRPPRNMWPIVLAMGLAFGVVGGGLAVVFGKGDDAEPPELSPSPVATADPDPAGDRASAPAVDATGGAPRPTSEAPGLLASLVDASSPPPSDAVAIATPTIDAVAIASPDVAATARLTIDSAPTGASVYGPDGKLLGKTRLEIEWPVADELVAFELRLPGYRKKPKSIVVKGNTTIGVDLEKLPAGRGLTGSAKGSADPDPIQQPALGSAGSADNLMRPGD